MLVKTHQSMAGIWRILYFVVAFLCSALALPYTTARIHSTQRTSLCWLLPYADWMGQYCEYGKLKHVISGRVWRYILGDLSKCRGSGSRDGREKSGKSLVPWIVLIAHVGLQVEFRYAGLGWVSRDSEITPTVEVLIAPSADTFSVGIYPLNGGIMIFRTSK